ncbi:MAG: SRPBCC family protein [Gemmatimonadales bacterium]
MSAARTNPTAFSTPSDREFAFTRWFDAPRQKVWEAWTDPRHVPHWMLGPEGWSMPTCEIDLRPGGAWHYAWRRTDGTEMEMRGTYREVKPPERLVHTEAWGGDWPQTVNTLVLTEENGGTRMTVTIRYPSKEARDRAMESGMRDGAARSFDRLDDYVRRG